MRADYQPYFEQLKKWMDRFGYLSLKESELSSEFFFANGWKLEFDCEPLYGPLFSIQLIAPSNIFVKRGYEFSLEDGTEIIRYDLNTLVCVFERLKGKTYEDLPMNDAIGVAMEFLRREREAIFENPQLYEAEYLAVGQMRAPEKNAIIESHASGLVTPPATQPPPKEPPPCSVVTA